MNLLINDKDEDSVSTLGVSPRSFSTPKNQHEPDREQRRKWMAVHIEADSDHSRKAARGLKELYIMSSTKF